MPKKLTIKKPIDIEINCNCPDKSKFVIPGECNQFKLSLCDVWEDPLGMRGGSWSPAPLSMFTLEPNSTQKSCSTKKVALILIHLIPLQNNSSLTLKWKSTEKLLNMSEISKICSFWDISTCNTSKKCMFHIEFNFKQKKIWFIWQKGDFFFSKSILTSCLWLQIFQISAKKF